MNTCPFKVGDTVRVDSPENVGIPIQSRIGTVTEVEVTTRDYNLVTFTYNDGDEVMIEDFNSKYKIGDKYNGIGLTLTGNPTATKIETFTRYYRHVYVRNNETGKLTSEHETNLLTWYL